MDNEMCHQLIRLYSLKEFLWNSKSKDYHNKSLRQDAWKDISSVLDLPIPDLKKKMTTLLASYRREKSRIAKSLITGSGADEVYESKWFAFEDFNFLKDKDISNDTTDTMLENIPPTQNEITSDEGPTEKQSEMSEENYTVPNTRPKRCIKRKTNTEDESPMLKKAYEILTETSSSSSDPYFSFGQHIANELRKYDHQTLIYVKQAINNVIFQADLGKYVCSYPNQFHTDFFKTTPSTQSTIESPIPSPLLSTPSPKPPISSQPPIPSRFTVPSPQPVMCHPQIPSPQLSIPCPQPVLSHPQILSQLSNPSAQPRMSYQPPILSQLPSRPLAISIPRSQLFFVKK